MIKREVEYAVRAAVYCVLVTLCLLLSLFNPAHCSKRSEEDFCPGGCLCREPNSLQVECESLDFSRIPSAWPSGLEKISLRNCSVVTIEKNAFRKFHELTEIDIDQCHSLDVIDKFAFKGLKKLRSISITRNPRLRELYKNSFTAIGNEHPLRISIKGNGLERIRAFAFRNAHDLRELTIEDHCFEVESNAFAGTEKIDFLNIKGACLIESYSFQNASRIHNLNIVDSSLDIARDTFSHLHHVNQIQLHENRIGKIETEAFGGMFTVGSLHLQSNQIGTIEARAFINTENLGSLTLSYNIIREPIDSSECLVNDAQRFVFTENNLHCSCEMRWIQFHYQDQPLLLENYCGRDESFKALSYYKPIGCPPLPTLSTTAASFSTSTAREEETLRQINGIGSIPRSEGASWADHRNGGNSLSTSTAYSFLLLPVIYSLILNNLRCCLIIS